MNTHRMKDEAITALLLLASILVSDAGGLFISQKVATKLKNETFFVLCRDNSTGSSVTWRGPKGILGPMTKPSVKTASYGTSLLFKQVGIEDSGTYTCSTKKGEKEEFHLSVAAPLTFMDTSTTQTGIEGKAFTLRCEVQGGKVTWSVENGDLTDKEKFVVGGDGLVIKKLDRSDSKTYICKAVQQSTGVIEDRKINLRVLHKPVFTHPKHASQEIAWGYINGTVNLTCIVVAEPPATFEWLTKNNKTLKFGKIINVSPQVSVLQMHVDKSTFGNYKCTASNSYGKLEKHFTLEQGYQPPPPGQIEQKIVNSHFLDLEIQKPDTTEMKPRMDPTGFRVEYRKKEDSHWESRDFNITKDKLYHLDNLTDNTAYEFRAATRNPAGLSEFSEIFQFKTLISESSRVHLASYSMLSFVAIPLLTQTYISASW